MDEMRDALLHRDRELQMMLGGIAHEVRNPLGGMELFVGLLREDLEGQDAELELLARVEKELGALKRSELGKRARAAQAGGRRGPAEAGVRGYSRAVWLYR